MKKATGREIIPGLGLGKGRRHREAALRGWCYSRERRSRKDVGRSQRPGNQGRGCVKLRLQGSSTRSWEVGSCPGKQQQV